VSHPIDPSSGIVISVRVSDGVADSLFDRASLGQVSHKSVLAIFVSGMPLADDGEAVAQNQLIDGGSKDRSWYVDKDCLEVVVISTGPWRTGC
jgi:hypothetical protein